MIIIKKKTEPTDIANSFNNYFINLPTNTSKTNNLKNIVAKSIFLTPIIINDTIKITKTLKNTNSVGFDGILTKVIKMNIATLATPLTHIINLSLSTGVYPDSLKLTTVIPVHKKGEKDEMKNYRPIALIPIISKIFEKVIYNQLYKFLETNNIITNQQNGFRKGKSTNLAIYDLLKPVLTNIDKKNPICSIFMDMTKAFDYVNHKLLLSKLESYGVRGIPLNLIKSYLSNRKQRTQITRISKLTKINTEYYSDFREIHTGVPQGSILGPLLFLIYINDLPRITHHPMVLFADDSTVIIKRDIPQNYEIDINLTLKNIVTWLEKNNLIINLEKTKIIHFRQRTSQPNIKANYLGETIENVEVTKFLGVSIDSNLSWSTHTEDICKKISRSVYALKKLSAIASIEAAIISYHGYVASILRYGVIFWGNSTNKRKVFLAQKKCIRAIFGLKPIDSCKPFFKKKKILTFPSLYILETASFIKSNVNFFEHYIPKYKQNLRPRSQHKIYPPKSCTAILSNNILGMGPRIYNKLPDYLKNLNNRDVKTKLFNQLIDKCYYSIEEFLNDPSP